MNGTEVLVTQWLEPVTKVHEFYAGEAYIEVTDDAMWQHTDDLFILPRCSLRQGRRRFWLFGERIEQCVHPAVGGGRCIWHGGWFDFGQWLVERDGQPWWAGPRDAAQGHIWAHRNVMQVIDAHQSCVYLFHKTAPGRDTYHPSLIAERGVAGPDDADTAWRLALGQFAAHQQ